MDLVSFRQRLQPLMVGDTSRPFVCSGSPMDCRFFIVGFNPATSTGHGFWRYWSDERGFDKFQFMEDYRRVRKLRGARPRIEAIVEQLPANWSLETNICSIPAKRAADLAREDMRTAAFQFLFEAIKPDLVFVHSNEPIEFFRHATGCDDFLLAPTNATWCGHRFTLFGRPGPIWRMAVDDARVLGRRFAAYLWNGPEGQSSTTTPPLPLAKAFAQRFANWSIKIPWRDLERRRAGRIAFEGWWIQYQFGQDDGGEFLDYLATHRMLSGGEHVRIHADGSTEYLPALADLVPISNNPVENQQLQARFYAEQDEVAAMLRRKGFIA